MRPTTQRKAFSIEPRRRGRYLFTHVMAMVQVAANGRPLGKSSHTQLGKYIWSNGGKTYAPNGDRERHRRLRQIERGHIKPASCYVDSIDYGDGTWEHKEFVNV